MTAVYELFRNLLLQWAEAGFLPESFKYAFVANAFFCAFLIGPLLGGIGTMVVTKRLAFFSQAVGQAAMTGVALGILLGEPYTSPYASLFGFCILFGLLMNFTRGRTKMSSDTVIGVFLSISLAVGACILLYVTAGVNIHILESILFGSILTVSDIDMNVLLVVAVICTMVSIPFYNRLLLGSFNSSLAHVRGVKVVLMEYMFVLMITVITVASLKIVGAVLVEALFIIPAAAARNISKSIRSFTAFSILFSTLACLLGVVIPLEFNIAVPSGGAIILVASFFFLITAVVRITGKRYSEGTL